MEFKRCPNCTESCYERTGGKIVPRQCYITQHIRDIYSQFMIEPKPPASVLSDIGKQRWLPNSLVIYTVNSHTMSFIPAILLRMKVYDFDVYSTAQLNAIKFGGMPEFPTIYNLTSRFFVILHGYSSPQNHESVASAATEFVAHLLQIGTPFLFISLKTPECLNWFIRNQLPVIHITGGAAHTPSFKSTLTSNQTPFLDAADKAHRDTY